MRSVNCWFVVSGECARERRVWAMCVGGFGDGDGEAILFAVVVVVVVVDVEVEVEVEVT